MKIFHLLGFFLLGTLSTVAQIQFNGIIKDTEENPLAFTNVLLLHPNDSTLVKGTISASNGTYQLANIRPGNYLLSAQMIGFQPHYEAIDLSQSITDFSAPDIFLTEQSTDLAEVTVTAEKPMFEQKIDRTIVNVQKSVTGAGSTALEVLERSPGISVDRSGSQISMNGRQGVVVMINGKRTRMEAGALLQLLSGMSSANIEKIELITRPPASFDAEGNAGVINIVMIRNEEEGLNGMATVFGGYGQRGKFGGNGNLNFRQKKWNFFTDVSSSWDYAQHSVQIDRELEFEGSERATYLFSDRPALIRLYSGRIGTDYELSEKTTMGVLLSGYNSYWWLDAQTKTERWEEGQVVQRSNLRSLEINQWKHWMGNVNLRHVFREGKQISFDFDYLDFIDENPTDYEEEVYDVSTDTLVQNRFNSRKETPVNFTVGKLDYQEDLSDAWQLSMGLKATLSRFVNDVSVSRERAGNWSFDPAFTDIFRLDENIFAAYLSTDYQLSEQTTLKAGLRYEYIDSHLGSATQENIVTQQRGRFFPTFYLTHRPKEDHQWQFSYGERITRPSFNVLAPAFFFFGPNTILAGNPSVSATITRQIKLSYQYKSFLLSLDFSDDDNPITWGQPDIQGEQNVTFVRAENMADRKTAILSLSFPFKISKHWTSRYNLNGYWQMMKPIFGDEVLTVTTMYYTANSTQSFSLPRDISLEFNARMNSALKYGLGHSPYRFNLDVGLQKTFKDQGKLSLNVADVFNWGSFFAIDYDSANLPFQYHWEYQMEGSVFRLTYSRPFGNQKVKKAGQRESGSSTERGRMN